MWINTGGLGRGSTCAVRQRGIRLQQSTSAFDFSSGSQQSNLAFDFSSRISQGIRLLNPRADDLCESEVGAVLSL
ncbi:hypothetical protein Taro_030401 [Colocasia esculenta]|uniref:Uncharacterized protein n=1 Tax=Colocasia esculenta TaxID=4460 RepID=A0A843VXT4_COLES|nr:hypothetical protein [Colocasia esculenta]